MADEEPIETKEGKELKQAKLELDKLKADMKKKKTVVVPTPDEDPVIEDDEDLAKMQKEIVQLQRKNLKNEKEAILVQLETINPKLKEKYAKADLSTLETALETAKEVSPKFAVQKDKNDDPKKQAGTHLDRNTGHYV